MKKLKIFTLIALIGLSTMGLLMAQRGHDGYHGGGYYHGGGGYHGGYGYYNHYGYAARPYIGVTTGPIGFTYGSNCGYFGYWHQWQCW
jgi:hypothetical protein